MNTLTEKFENVARMYPRKAAMVMYDGESVYEYSYRQIFDDVMKIAGWLCRQGIKKEDKVAIIMENGPEWGICYFGILFSGAVAVPVDVQSGIEEMGHILAETETKIIFTSDKVRFNGFSGFKFLEKIVAVGRTDSFREDVVSFSEILEMSVDKICNMALPRAEPDDTASIIYTSGTTGPPKGVMLTHKNFCSNFSSISKLNVLDDKDNFLSVLPLHHAFPFMGTLIVPFLTGARIIYIKSLKAEFILKSLKEGNVTIFMVTPQVLHYFFKRIEKRIKMMPLGLGSVIGVILNISWKLSSRFGINPAIHLQSRFRSILGPHFRYFICGGAKLDEKLAENFFKVGFEILEGYGLTETSPVASINPPGKPRIGSAGKALPGVEIKINDAGENEIGEILVRGDNVMKGYYQNDEETRRTIRNGWFYSGDLGCLDNEGYLFVRGRAKEIIVLRSGKNISPEEVEKHYEQAPSIREIFILAGSEEEKLAALIVADLKYLKEAGEVSIYNKVKWDLEILSEKLPPYQRIKKFVIMDIELPRTRLGKIKRYEAQHIYEKAIFAGKPETKKRLRKEKLSSIGKRVVEVVMREAGKKEISVNDHLELDLGMDSLGRVELMASLEEEFAIILKEEALLQLVSVNELIQHVEDELKGGEKKTREEKHSWRDILSSELPVSLMEKVDIGSGRGSWFVILLVSLIMDNMFRLFFKFKVYGKKNLEKGAYVISPNHTSFLDAFIVFSALPLHLRRQLFFVGLSKYVTMPVIERLIKLLKVIPLDPVRNLVETMQLSAYVLKNGKILCIFPEGGRSISGEVRTFRKGVGVLSKESGVKVVPAYISGTHDVLKPGSLIPRFHHIKVIFGKPCLWQELEEKGHDIHSGIDSYEAVSLGLRNEVFRLREEIEKR